MLRSSRAYVFYKRDVFQDVTKFTEKHVWQNLFIIKLSLQLYYRKTPTQVFSCEFFEIIMGKFFIKHLWRLLLNADDWKNTRDCWYLFLTLWGLTFWMIAFSWTFSWDIKTLSSNILLKIEGIDQVSKKVLLCWQYVFYI